MSLSISKGDVIWVELKGADQNYGHGEVTDVWFEKSLDEQCFYFYCLVNGGFRMGSTSKLITKPTARMTSKLLQSRKDFNEIMKSR